MRASPFPLFALLLGSLGLAAPAVARINVDTLPARDSAQLTIYNSVDLTMVRETRFLTLRKGLNRLEFSWANTLIDPTSVEFKALTHADDVEVLDVSFPPRVTNTLEWRVQSEVAGEVQVEIRYFTSGISWAADYVLEAGRDEKAAELAGFVKVNNQSGEDYENAQIRLVVGEIRLVELIAKLAREPHGPEGIVTLGVVNGTAAPMSAPAAAPFGGGGGFGGRREYMMAKVKEVMKEGLSEYFLYTVEGRDTIPNTWSKRLPSFAAKSVPLTSYYKYEREQRGDHVERFYRFKNNTESKLGKEPLPNGQVIAFRTGAGDNLRSMVGQTSVKYIPINEEIEMDLGNDREVLAEPSLTDWRKDDLKFDKDGNISGWTVTQSWRVETRNSKEIPITLDLRRNFQGDWSVKSDAPFEKVDAGKIKFVFNLNAREKRTITYEVVEHFGVNANR